MPLRYEGLVRLLVQRLKFSGDLAAARPLVESLQAAVASGRDDQPLPDALLPVPLHPRRLAERGFNQAERLARPLSKQLGVPLSLNSLRRGVATAAQSQLDARARRRNVRGAFAVCGPVPDHVAIVDDVVTTGSTVSEIARILRRAGCKRIEVWAAARAPAPD
ncbi:MAG: ComF family protein [Halothiobacillaceae bacterium]